MRIAYIGLSTPILYDYKNPASRTKTDFISSPNPILDSPFGLLLLFDELWFLLPSLCPENMRKLPYVKFLNENPEIEFVKDIKQVNIYESLKENQGMKDKYDRFLHSLETYPKIKDEIGMTWDASWDNHTHTLSVFGNQYSGNSLRLENVLFDLEVVSRLPKNVELITNTFTNQLFENNPLLKINLAEFLVIDNIPNYQSKNGPYHECIEEARANNYLQAYRNWITNKPKINSKSELLKIKQDVEKSIQEFQNKLFLKYLDPKTQYLSIGKTVFDVVTAQIPGVSNVTSLLSLVHTTSEHVNQYFESKERKWQGFIVSGKINI